MRSAYQSTIITHKYFLSPNKKSKAMKLNDIMTSESLLTTTPESTLTEAAQTMKTGNCGALPVVNSSNEVVGMITDRDICLALAEGTTSTTKKVKEVMTTSVSTVSTTDTLEAVLRVMRENQVGRVPVLDGSRKLKGIISFQNLFTAAGENGTFDKTQLKDKGENILKTMHALSNRYASITASSTSSRTTAIGGSSL
jgi:CBS domain-containing protein